MVLYPTARIVTVSIPYHLAERAERSRPEGFLDEHIVDLLRLETEWASAHGVRTLQEVRAKLEGEAVRTALTPVVTRQTDEFGNKIEVNHEMGG